MTLARTSNLEVLRSKSVEAAELMRLLANASRLQLLAQIALGESSVRQLEEVLEIQQPALSQQLAELRKAGLVKTRRVSRSIFYSLADARVRALLEMLCATFCEERKTQAKAPVSGIRRASMPAEAGDAAQFARLGG